MLRQKIRKIIINRKNHYILTKLSRLLIILGIMWILSFPYLSRDVFTSENALNGKFLSTTFGSDAQGFTVFKQLQEKMKLTDPRNGYRDLIIQRLGLVSEVYL